MEKPHSRNVPPVDDEKRSDNGGEHGREASLRTRIIQHCRNMYAVDKEYASAAFDWYQRECPWLNLERK